MQLSLNLLAVLSLGLPISITSSSNLPNPNCTIVDHILRCDDVTVPQTFKVGSIPVNLTQIYIGATCFSAPDRYCNVLGDGAEPFPASLVSLEKVYFKGFRSKQTGDFKFNVLLDKVKGQLLQLNIYHSKIEKLEAMCFKGYRSLQRLWISSGIREISLDAFVEITDSGISPSLIQLQMYGNALTSFDWGILRPVSSVLQEIHLESQKPGLQKVFRSTSPIRLFSLNKVRLDGNKLTTIPQEVLETIPGTDRITFNLQKNTFCPNNSDCSCCALKDLAQWAKAQGRTRFNIDLKNACGTIDRPSTLFWDSWIGLPETVANLVRDC